MKYALSRLSLLLLAVGAAGCQEGLGPGNHGAIAEIRILAVGDTLRGLARSYQLHALVLDSNGTQLDSVPLEWTSSAPDVATVDENGTVQTVAVGAARIAAAAGGVQGATELAVADQAGMIATAKGPICALNEQGLVYCWGAEWVGMGLTNDPKLMDPDLVFHSVNGGWAAFVCGLTTAGRALCWGRNNTGGLGDGTLTDRASPTPVSGDLLFQFLRSTGTHTCGITETKEVYCWGWSDRGQVGSGAADMCSGTPCSLVPALVDTDQQFRSLSLSSVSSCGLEDSGDLYCWGALSSRTTVTTPQPFVPGYRFKQVASATWQQCGIGMDGQTYCWPIYFSWADPAPIGGPQLVYISDAVGGHFCGLDAGGAAYCWGTNYLGQLGIGVFSDTVITTPQPVVGGLSFTSIAAGDQYTCAMTASSQVYCWGFNQGNEGLVDPTAGEPCPSFPSMTCYPEPRLTRFNP